MICDFMISETTDDAMVKQKQFNQSGIGGKTYGKKFKIFPKTKNPYV